MVIDMLKKRNNILFKIDFGSSPCTFRSRPATKIPLRYLSGSPVDHFDRPLDPLQR